MREIGARELKATLSQTLRSVARGERVRVTVRGRAVADLVPAGRASDEEHLRELIVAGRLTPAARAKPDREPRLIKGRGSASALILAERDLER
jgi:prevent-host-death family protein